MITRFALRNFKGFREQSFDLAPITVLVGRNGTGKSSVLQALAFLKQSSLAGEAVYSAGEGPPVLAELGSFEEVVHMGGSGLPVTLEMEARLDSLGPVPWPASGKGQVGTLPATLNYRCALRARTVNQEWLSVESSGPNSITLDSRKLRRFGETGGRIRSTDPFRGIRRDSRTDKGFPGLAELRRTQDSDRLGRALSVQLQRFFFVPAVRGFVGQTFPLRDHARADLTTAVGYSEFAGNAATALAMNRDLEEQVSDWLEQVVSLRVQAKLGENKAVSIVFQPPRRKNRRMDVGANHESFGANQLSHVFLQIALAGKDRMVGKEAVIGIEEPEAHLHPRAQRDLVETLAAIVKGGEHQFIISTHSERIVSRLLVLVAKGKLSAEDVAVYAFDKDDEGVTSAAKCEIDEVGRIVGDVAGFFEEGIADMSEIVETFAGRGS